MTGVALLAAYIESQRLEKLGTELPENVEHVMQELRCRLNDGAQTTQAMLLLARCHLLRGNLNDAKRTLETLVSQDPDNVTAKTELAKICFGDKDTREAIRLLNEVTELRPEITGNWRLLSEYLQQGGQIEASQNALKQHDLIKSFNDRLLIAEQAFARADFKTADNVCRQLLQLVPNEARTLRLLARIARQFRYYEFSTATLARCVANRPRDAALGLDYAYSLLGSRMYREALEQCQKLIDLSPATIEVYELKAEILYNLGKYEEAIAIYRELSEIPEKRALTLQHLGKVLKTVGQTADAKDCYQKSITADPSLGQAWWELANLKIYRYSGDEIASMQQLAGSVDTAPMNKILVQFALGKALEDAGQYAESFENYRAANSAYARIRPSRYVGQNALFKSVFTEGYFSARKEFGSDTTAPIFIVGLPRSGSTLVEQILSSHSQVDATSELDEITSIARGLSNPAQPEQQYPSSMERLSADESRNLAQRYLGYAQEYRQQAPYFLDKAPLNFHHIGLIKTLFPSAKIIDIRRNPMASGWSVYKQFFAESFLFSYDLETIGNYYADYLELMNHWHTVLPQQILTISYEDLVEDLPATTASMLEYCGLEFEDACLNFHQNRRAVATPSSEQVRRPIYRDAIDHWKNYDAFLLPLKRVLAKRQVSGVT